MGVVISYKEFTTTKIDITKPCYSVIKSPGGVKTTYRCWDGTKLSTIECSQRANGSIAYALNTVPYPASSIKTKEAAQKIRGLGRFFLSEEDYFKMFDTAAKVFTRSAKLAPVTNE
jgi:hypothetical protein